MKKVLIINGAFTPAINYGGPVVSIVNFCKGLHKRFDLFVLTVDHDLGSETRFENIKEGWNESETEKTMYLRKSEVNYTNINNIVNELKPDLVYLNSFYLYRFAIPAFIICKKQNIPLLIAPRGELGVDGYKPKKLKKIVYNLAYRHIFAKEKSFWFQATTKGEVPQYHSLLGIDFNRIVLLNNMPTIPEESFEKSVKKKGMLKCIYLSRIHPHKNLDMALRVLSKVQGEIIYDIYGPIEDQEYWDACLKVIQDLPANIIVNYCGIVPRNQINMIYSQYDILFCPTKSENFGHAFVEAMLSSCPIVTSDQTPWTDINEKNAGWALPLDSEDGFVKVIQKIIDMDNLEYKNLVRTTNEYITVKINLNKLIEEYTNNINKIIDNEVI